MIIHEYVLHFNESTAFLCKSQTTLHQFTVTPLRVGGCTEHQHVAEGSRLTSKCSVNNEMRCSIRLLSDGKPFSPSVAACGEAIAFIKRAFCFTGRENIFLHETCGSQIRYIFWKMNLCRPK